MCFNIQLRDPFRRAFSNGSFPGENSTNVEAGREEEEFLTIINNYSS